MLSLSRLCAASLLLALPFTGCDDGRKTASDKSSRGGFRWDNAFRKSTSAGDNSLLVNAKQPSVSRRVFTSPKVMNVVQAAGADAQGKAVAIGNVKVTLPTPPSNRAMLEFDFHPLKPPLNEFRYMCLFRAASGEFSHVEITGEMGNQPLKRSHKVGYRLVTEQFRPPYTVVVRRWPLRGNRSQTVEVSNRLTIR